MRERVEYRDNLESLLKHFGGKHLLTINEVAEYCGKDRRTVTKRFNLQAGGITVETLARRMST